MIEFLPKNKLIRNPIMPVIIIRRWTHHDFTLSPILPFQLSTTKCDFTTFPSSVSPIPSSRLIIPAGLIIITPRAVIISARRNKRLFVSPIRRLPFSVIIIIIKNIAGISSISNIISPEMWSNQINKISFEKRDVEAFAVIGDDDLVFLDIPDEIFQVFPLDIIFDGGPVIQGNGGDVRVPMA